jgi:N-acetylmuramoyl-L-alanine amidase
MFNKTKKIFLLSLLLVSLFWGGANTLTAATNNYKIVVDPAHGGSDAGVKITDTINEKDITLAIALALQTELSKEGNIKVILSRVSDKDVTAENRKKIVQENKPNFFLSIHINRGFGKHASGFELYYPGFDKAAANTKKDAKGLSPERIKYLNESVRMAHLIQRNLDSVFPRMGRGLREADVPVLEGLHLPALVVEIGFASNSDDRKKLLSAKTQKEIARALSRSIKSFYR